MTHGGGAPGRGIEIDSKTRRERCFDCFFSALRHRNGKEIEKAIKARIDCHVRSTEAPADADSSGYFRVADGSCLVYRIGV